MSELQYNQVAKIKVFGIGGAGCNAVNRMVEDELKGVEFFVTNTDLQVLNISPCKNKIILGKTTTKGLGAGANPEVGLKAAIESEEEIKAALKGADMVFLTAGLGGGTGTGAAPLFAKLAHEMGILTVGIVTKPFSFEGKKRMDQALAGLENLQQYTDSLIVVSNNQLLEAIGRIPFVEAFREADNVLRQGVQTITDLIAVPAIINLDFADVRTVMESQGTALIGIGMSQGENKAHEAAAKAITSPLLEAHIRGAKKAIVNVTGGQNINLMDADDAVRFIREAAGGEVDIIFGVAINESLGDNIIVTVIATGFDLPKENITTRPTVEATKLVNDPSTIERFTPKEDEVDDSTIPGFFKSRG
jgi:cell division protein FtsZ